jgi:hypothetical protein
MPKRNDKNVFMYSILIFFLIIAAIFLFGKKNEIKGNGRVLFTFDDINGSVAPVGDPKGKLAAVKNDLDSKSSSKVLMDYYETRLDKAAGVEMLKVDPRNFKEIRLKILSKNSRQFAVRVKESDSGAVYNFIFDLEAGQLTNVTAPAGGFEVAADSHDLDNKMGVNSLSMSISVIDMSGFLGEEGTNTFWIYNVEIIGNNEKDNSGIIPGAYAAEPGDGDDDDKPDKIKPGAAPRNYLPADPRVKKLKLQALILAEKFTKILAERSKLQPMLGEFESQEANLRHLTLKYRLEYYQMRDFLLGRAARDGKIKNLLKNQEVKLARIEDLIKQEEKIDCLHTIYERKHKALEEYHWSLMDNKHPLIEEYLQDLPYSGHEKEFESLYGEIIQDYTRIIEDNHTILKETKEIIEGKKKRQVLMQKAAEMMKSLVDETKPYFSRRDSL